MLLHGYEFVELDAIAVSVLQLDKFVNLFDTAFALHGLLELFMVQLLLPFLVLFVEYFLVSENHI